MPAKVAFMNLFPTREFMEAALTRLPSTLNEREKAKAEDDIRKDIADKVQRHNQRACEVGKQNSRLISFIGIQKSGLEQMARLLTGHPGWKKYSGSS
ncbi:hypothetical protein ACFLTY_04655 [Chloroflexota bacterium]